MASAEFGAGAEQNSGGASGSGSRALVPLVTLARRPSRRSSPPDSSFVTQLMATATMPPQRPAQAMAAYRSVVDHNHPPIGAGIRFRQSV